MLLGLDPETIRGAQEGQQGNLVAQRPPALFAVPMGRYNVETIRKLAHYIWVLTEGSFCSSISVHSARKTGGQGSGIPGGGLNKEGA